MCTALQQKHELLLFVPSDQTDANRAICAICASHEQHT